MEYRNWIRALLLAAAFLGRWLASDAALAQDVSLAGPDPREIPIRRIQGPLGTVTGVDQLPVRREMPDVMLMNDGTRVTTRAQWEKRRQEIKRTLAYYAVGQMPPAPGNVKGQELQSELVLDGSVKDRLSPLTVRRQCNLSLNIGTLTTRHYGS